MTTYHTITQSGETFLKKENPCRVDHYNNWGLYIKEWLDFDRANPPILLLDPIPWKEIYTSEDVELGHQAKLSFVWSDISALQYYNYRKANEASMHGNVYDTRQVFRCKAPEKEKKVRPRYERVLPYDVDLEDLLLELLEYMEDRQDVNDGESGASPNKEMNFANEINQVLYQLERQKPLRPIAK